MCNANVSTSVFNRDHSIKNTSFDYHIKMKYINTQHAITTKKFRTNFYKHDLG